jgi:hypothetical protein
MPTITPISLTGTCYCAEDSENDNNTIVPKYLAASRRFSAGWVER